MRLEERKRVAQSGDYKRRLSAHSVHTLTTVVNDGSQSVVVDVLVMRTFVRGLPAALTSVTRKQRRQVIAYLRPAEEDCTLLPVQNALLRVFQACLFVSRPSTRQ